MTVIAEAQAVIEGTFYVVLLLFVLALFLRSAGPNHDKGDDDQGDTHA